MGFLPNPGTASAVPGILVGAILLGVDLRNLLWVGLYTCLTLSVLSAVAAAVTGTQAMWQVVWTFMVWSGTCGVWVFVNRGSRTPREWPTAVPMVLTGIAAVCWTAVVWDSSQIDRMAGTGAIMLVGCAITAPALALWGRGGWRRATRGALVMQLVGMACWLVVIWRLVPVDVSAIGAVLQFGSIAYAANFVWTGGDQQPGHARRVQFLQAWKLAVLWAAVLLMSYCLTIGWNSGSAAWGMTPRMDGTLSTLMTVAALASTLSVWLGMRNVMSHSKAPAWARRVHLVVQALAVLLGLALTYTTVWDSAYGYGVLERMVGALTVAVLAGLALSVITEVLARMHTIRSVMDITSVRMQCPACQTKLFIKPGGGVCTKCGLGIQLRMQPTVCLSCRCPLDYSSTKDTCPECGTPFRAALEASDAVVEAPSI